jgi:hypothetical protein
VRGLLQHDDAGADLADRAIEVRDRGQDPVGGTARAQQARHGLQGQSGGEQPLNDVVVQVRGNLLAIGEHRRPLLLGAGLGQLEGDRGPVGEPRGHVHVVGAERGPAA